MIGRDSQKVRCAGGARLFSFLTVFAILLALFFAATVPAAAKSGKQTVTNMRIDAVLEPNGDARITETWELLVTDRGRSYSNFYRTFDLASGKEAGADGIVLESVLDLDSGSEYRFAGDIDPEDITLPGGSSYLHKKGSQIEIGWFAPQFQSGTRTFQFTYTIENLLNVYGDVAEFYNYFIPNDFTFPVTELNVHVTLPQAVSDPQTGIHAWLHAIEDSGWTVREDGTGIDFSVRNLPEETSVELHMTAPAAQFAASPKQKGGEALPRIQAEEQGRVEKVIAHQNFQRQMGSIDLGAGLLFAVLGAVSMVFLKRRYRPYQVEVPEYWREIPDWASPGGIARLFYYYKHSTDFTKEQKGNIYSATLLSLARKGWLSITADEDAKDFRVVFSESPIQPIPLSPSEEVLYQLFSQVARQFGGSFTMDQFERYGEEEYESVDSQSVRFWEVVETENASRGWFGARGGTQKTLMAVGAILPFAAILIFVVLAASDTLAMVYLPIGLAVFGILLCIGAGGKARLTREGQEEWARWQGLRKYMLDFSNLKEYSVPQLALWEEYLVYAAMMGVSKAVSEQLRLVYPALCEDDYIPGFHPSFYTYFWYSRMFRHGGRMDMGERIANVTNNVTAAATRLAHPTLDASTGSGSGHGGGFGGGGFGGGFGGGGGGGCR